MQANYDIEENDRKEEKDTDNRIQCTQIDKSIHELKGNKDSKWNVWQLKLFNYRFPSIEANKQLNNKYNIDELNEIKSGYEKAIAESSKKWLSIKASLINEMMKLKKRRRKINNLQNDDFSFNEAN